MGQLRRRGRHNAPACGPHLPLRPIRHPVGPPLVHGSGNVHGSVHVAATIQTGPRRTGSVCIAGVNGVSPGRTPATIQGFTEPARSAGDGSGTRRFRHVQDGLMGARSGPGTAADRTSEPDRRLDREPPHGPVVTLGMCHWDAPKSPQSQNPQPSIRAICFGDWDVRMPRQS